MIKTYSKKKDGNTKLSKDFTVKEFACKNGADVILIDTQLVEILQKIRDHFQKPITINSAYRTYNHNILVGGTSRSQHLKGTAADIVVTGVSPEEIVKYAEYLMPTSGGIGLYSTFAHIDVRSNRARWKNLRYGVVAVKKFSGYPEKPDNYISVTDAISILNKKGIISDTDKWYSGTWDDDDFKWLLRKVGTFIADKM